MKGTLIVVLVFAIGCLNTIKTVIINVTVSNFQVVTACLYFYTAKLSGQ